MKTIIAGSREGVSYEDALAAIHMAPWGVTEIVSGGAKGADSLGERYAAESGLPLKQFLPDWERHGRAAGPIRNGEMAKYADGLIALWDGESRGTANMIKEARARKKLVLVYYVAGPRKHACEVFGQEWLGKALPPDYTFTIETK